MEIDTEKTDIEREKVAGNDWRWGGVTSFIMDGDMVAEVNLVKTCGSYYSTKKLPREDKVDKTNIGDKPDEFERVGVASICTDPTNGSPEALYDIFLNERTGEWTSHEVSVEVNG